MLKSMTGYGRAESAEGEAKIVVEVKSSNHRYCDVSLRIPQKCFALENEIKRFVLARLTRGRIELSIQFESEEQEEQNLELNIPLARRYCLLLKQLKENLQLSEEITLDQVLTQKDVIVSQATTQNQVCEWEVMKGPLSSAIDELVRMRGVEGLQLKEDFLSRLNKIESLLDQIKHISDSASEDHHKSLGEKIQALCKNMEIDESRLAQEVAYLVEKSDISEELVRVKSHLIQFKEWLDSEDAVGRRLDFLIQEIHREVNTIGSKSYRAEVSLKVVEIKNELERIREQVQNIE
ncbi:MAG: YicC family protein [Deltaproteobacteria bacterium]|nr:YicC family protein [Deltaproteobacteria bacterium]